MEFDRSVNEHFACCNALHLFATYDQLNVPNIAGCEAVNARRQLIEPARDGHPAAPRWHAASDLLGYQGQGSALIDPERVAFVAARQSQKAKIIEATMKAKEANAAWNRWCER